MDGNYQFHVLVICLVGIAFIRDYYYLNKFTRRQIIFHKHLKFKIRSPYSEIESQRYDLNYSKLINIDFKLLRVPTKCSEEPFLLTVLVTSALTNFEVRKRLRRKWRDTNGVVKLVFVLGVKIESITNEDINSESFAHKDILQGNFIDTYRNLSYKHIIGLKWVTHHCPVARYVIKMDDDCEVDPLLIIPRLRNEISPWGAQGLLAGFLKKTLVVERDNAKWKVTKEEYALNAYPPYCIGLLILYSYDVVPLLVEQSQKTAFFHIEDVFVTGFLAEAAGIWRTKINQDVKEIYSTYLRI